MARVKTTLYVDPQVLRATRAYAVRKGKSASAVVEDALREFLGLALVDRIRARADLDEEEAMRLAYDGLRAARRERRRGTTG
jgi:hypothetical protein